MISRVDIPPRTVCQPRLHWVISHDWPVGFDPILAHNYFDRVGFSRILLAYGKHLQCERSSMSFLHDTSHKKAILSLYQIGAPSKHAPNEDEQHLNSNYSTKRNIHGRIRAICMQHSAPPGYKHN